jgi:hypothetical protein
MKIPVLSLFACLFALPSSVSAGELQAADRTGGAAQAAALAPGTLEREMARGVANFLHSAHSAHLVMHAHQTQQNQPKKHNWIGRYPVLCGTLAGFGTGFILGYKNGNPSARNDPSSDYLTPEKKGLLWGGIGAGGGALLGWAVGTATR